MITEINLNTYLIVIVGLAILLLQVITIVVHVRKNRTLAKVLDANAVAVDAIRVNNEALRVLNSIKLAEHGKKIDAVNTTVKESAEDVKQTIVEASESGNKLKTIPPNTI